MSVVESGLTQGATVVTATRALAWQVLDRHARAQRAAGRVGWPSPPVYSWSDWLRESWQRTARRQPGAPVLLTEMQSVACWESVIADAEGRSPTGALLNIKATARAARAAWHLLHDWRLAVTEVDGAGNADVAAFLHWARRFAQTLRERRWLDGDTLGAALLEMLAHDHWRPGPVLLIGFDSLTPIQRGIAEAVDARSVSHEAKPAVSACRIACIDSASEMLYAARWSLRRIAGHADHIIGIVVDDLFEGRDEMDRAFAQAAGEFELAAGHSHRASVPYHMSVGRPLCEYPVVDAALQLLRFMNGFHSSGELSRFLRSPFCRGGLTEATARSLVDEWLRRRGIADLTPRGLLTWLRRRAAPPAEACPLLAQSLQAATALAAPGRQTPNAWIATFSAWLAAFGWPGDRALDNAEYQTVAAWNELLAKFASLALIVGECSRQDALDKLAGIARDRVYQPQGHPASIHVMTPAESTGMQFDSLWVMGMSEAQWPPPVRPNPFLPAALQRRLGMPRSDPTELLAYAQRERDRWLESAENIVVSHPTSLDDHAVAVGALFGDLVAVTADDLGVAGLTHAEQISQRRAPLELLADPAGPPITDSGVMPGGASVFRDQAACPFRAFARHRLGARPIAEIALGLDAGQRGDLVHQCLAEMWRTLRDRAGLVRLSPQELSEVLGRVVDAVVAPMPVRGGRRFHAALMELERTRLITLLGRWSACERDREDFVVAHCEREIVATFASLRVRLRIDRIDRLADQSLFVIDYKTGSPNKPLQWFGVRPDEPQLPAYLVGLSEPVSAMAFAEVGSAMCRWRGLCRAASPAPGVDRIDTAGIAGIANWDQAVATWTDALLGLVRAFQAGDARVMPKGDDSCRYCEVYPLCRIAEHRQTRITEDEPADGG